MDIIIREEQQHDIVAIEQVTQAAFKTVEYSNQTEHLIVNALRERGKLLISLVAVENNDVIGHIAISPVRLSSGDQGWYGLGPVSVRPSHQRRGIGAKLIQESLHQLRQQDASGCVLLGDPNYYAQFGFKVFSNLVLADVPAEYFQALSFDGTAPCAEVFYDGAFYVTN